jgi:hypothetical protein
MVCQDYGASLASLPSPPPQRKGVNKNFGVLVAAALGCIALVAYGMTTLREPQPVALGQHLMSEFTINSIDSSSDDTTSLADDSGSNFYGHWGHFHHTARSAKGVNKWQAALQKLKQAQANRRHEEDQEYFSGIDKAFGKKAGAAMMAAFNGGKKTSLSHFKLDDKKLHEQKEKLATNTQLPDSHKEAHKDAHKEAKKAIKKAVATKKAHEEGKKQEAKAKAEKAHDKKEKAAVVSEALKVAKQMSDHKDPVAHDVKATAKKQQAALKAKEAHKAHKSLKHPGVIADAKEIQQDVHELHHAHGKKKKELKARVMQLRQDIVSDYNKVTAFGHRAQTKFQREEAKEKKH